MSHKKHRKTANPAARDYPNNVMTATRTIATSALVLFCAFPILAGSRPADFALILDAPSIAERPGHNRAALSAIRAQQQSLRLELRKRAIPVTGAVSTLVNAIFVRV